MSQPIKIDPSMKASWDSKHRYHRAETVREVSQRAQQAKVNKCGLFIRHYIMSLEFQGLFALLTLVDIVGTIYELAISENEHNFWFWFHVGVLFIYTLEFVLMLSASGIRNFLLLPRHVVQAVIIIQLWISSVILFDVTYHNWTVIVKPLYLLEEIITFVSPSLHALRQKVSMNKFRYVSNVENIDLDLTYITRDLIAMSVPVTGWRFLFRNPIGEVGRFFNIRHESQFRIYNACPELPYSDEVFLKAGGEVVRLHVQDHSPPTMNQFLLFLLDARRWKGGDTEKVLAVHCKGGKGRTGSLCCAWLMYSKQSKDADEALKCFAKRRTDESLGSKLQGVETPSQIRYVKQLWHFLKKNDSWLTSPMPPPKLDEPEIRLHSLEFVGGLIRKSEKLFCIKILIQCGGGDRPLELRLETPPMDASTARVDLEGLVVSGDVRIAVFRSGEKDFSAHDMVLSAKNLYSSKGILFSVLFHTGFVSAELGGSGDLDLQPTSIGTVDESTSARPPNETSHYLKSFEVPVEMIDKACAKPKLYPPGSSLVLNYTLKHQVEV